MCSCEQESLGQNWGTAFVVPLVIVVVEANAGKPGIGVYLTNASISIAQIEVIVPVVIYFATTFWTKIYIWQLEYVYNCSLIYKTITHIGTINTDFHLE